MNQKTLNLLLKARRQAGELRSTLMRARNAPGGLTGIWINGVLLSPTNQVCAGLSDASLDRFKPQPQKK